MFSRIVNSTVSLHIVECSIMFFSSYIHRNFPKEFSLSSELALNLVAGWFINTMIDYSNAYKDTNEILECFFGVFRRSFVIDVLRCVFFIVIIYVTTISAFSYFPLPYTWVFEDFSKFIFEPQCVRVFLHYLKVKEPEKLNTMNKLMKLYVTEFDKKRDSHVSRIISHATSPLMTTPTRGGVTGEYSQTLLFQSSLKPETTDIASRVQFLEIMQQMEPSFKRYKKTKSFAALYTKMKNFEDITEHTAQNW